MQNWVNEMAAYVKSLDSNHLLTVGEEGFYTSTQNQTYCNPSSSAREQFLTHGHVRQWALASAFSIRTVLDRQNSKPMRLLAVLLLVVKSHVRSMLH